HTLSQSRALCGPSDALYADDGRPERGREDSPGCLLSVHAGRSEFTRIKDTPRQATLKHLRQWTERLTWLEAILTPQPFLRGIAHTKMQQFAAEAAALDVGDMRAILDAPRRWSLLLCFLHHAQVQTRDQLVEMLLKRMRHITN